MEGKPVFEQKSNNLALVTRFKITLQVSHRNALIRKVQKVKGGSHRNTGR